MTGKPGWIDSGVLVLWRTAALNSILSATQKLYDSNCQQITTEKATELLPLLLSQISSLGVLAQQMSVALSNDHQPSNNLTLDYNTANFTRVKRTTTTRAKALA